MYFKDGKLQKMLDKEQMRLSDYPFTQKELDEIPEIKNFKVKKIRNKY